MNTVKVGIIGIGNIGSAHASAVYSGEVDGMTLAALCDTDQAKLSILKEKYPSVPLFSNAEDMMKSGLVDAVIISVPHYGHPPLAIMAFSYGLHVITEKPGGVNCSEVKKMIVAAKTSGKVFGVMFNQRNNSLFAYAKELIASGKLGDIKRSVWIITNWYRKQCYYDSGSWRATWSGEGGGVLLNQAPHNLDLWQWICGMPSSVYAECNVGKYHKIEVEDEATIFAEYPNGATGVFITSTGDYPGTNRLEISGTKGKIVIENGKLTFSSFLYDEKDFRMMAETDKNPIEVTEICDTAYNGHVDILKNFTRAILYGEKLLAPGEDSLNELTISNAAYLSSWTGKKISLPLDDELFDSLLKKKIETSLSTDKKQTSASLSSDYLGKWNTNW
ncbi:MAG: Gfo/Idh/MocA family oxidoreductase [Clostridia bacterium]|nr:Gfo/Idh/MocA family oxidoreductase [Clostridia bacterium]